MRSRILIIGLGNPLMLDEGIGVRLAGELAQHVGSNTDVMDLGTGGMTVMHAIAGRDKVIFVDCALMGEKPGTMRRFGTREAMSKKVLTRQSLHESDLFHILDLSRKLGECPENIVIFGIEPKTVANGEGLSQELESRIPAYVSTILAETVDIGGS